MSFSARTAPRAFIFTYHYNTSKWYCQHIFPKKIVFQDLEIDNTSDNTVILLHKDHILSHIYLEKCSCVDWFKHYNGIAVTFALNNSIFKNLSTYESERLFIENLDIYQQVIEDCNRLKSQHFKGHVVSEETKQKIMNFFCPQMFSNV